MKVTRYEPRQLPDIEAILFDASLGWEHVLELAKWCGGEARRDETHEAQREKTYYWSILFEGEYGNTFAHPGDYIAYDGDEYLTLGDDDIAEDYIELENA